jgi:hypothetical protein
MSARISVGEHLVGSFAATFIDGNGDGRAVTGGSFDVELDGMLNEANVDATEIVFDDDATVATKDGIPMYAASTGVFGSPINARNAVYIQGLPSAGTIACDATTIMSMFLDVNGGTDVSSSVTGGSCAVTLTTGPVNPGDYVAGVYSATLVSDDGNTVVTVTDGVISAAYLPIESDYP